MKSLSFTPLQLPSNMCGNPRKELLDPREHIGNRFSVQCAQCKVLNLDKFNCYYCGYQLSSDTSHLSFGYKVGSQVLTRAKYTQVNDELSKHAKDYLQPMRYNKLTKKMEKNQDYIKVYGDPFKAPKGNKTKKGKK